MRTLPLTNVSTRQYLRGPSSQIVRVNWIILKFVLLFKLIDLLISFSRFQQLGIVILPAQFWIFQSFMLFFQTEIHTVRSKVIAVLFQTLKFKVRKSLPVWLSRAFRALFEVSYRAIIQLLAVSHNFSSRFGRWRDGMSEWKALSILSGGLWTVWKYISWIANVCVGNQLNRITVLQPVCVR